MLYVHPQPMAIVGTPLFVIGGDVHLHVWNQFNPLDANGLPRRLNVGIHVVKQGIEHAKKLGVPFIINGDLLHSKNSLDPAVIHAVHDLFSREFFDKSRVILNVGNHEIPDKFNSNVTTLDWLEGLAQVVREPMSIALKDCTVHVVPFSGDHKAQMNKMLDCMRGSPSANILLAHFPTNGVDLGGYKLESAVEFADFHPEKFDAVLFNDIHKHQPVGQNGYHLGCTHQNNFGEAGYEFGWWCASWDGRIVHITRLEVIAPVFGLVNSDEEVQGWREAGHFARIRPEAAIKHAMAAQEAPRLTVNTSALPKTIHEYVAYMVKDGKFKPEDAAEIERRSLALLNYSPMGGGER